MTERMLATIDVAIVHLSWCNTMPHRLEQILGINAEATSRQARPLPHGLTNDQIIGRITRQTAERFGSGGHSDPTADAALAGEPHAIEHDVTTAEVTAAVEQLHGNAIEIDHLCADALGLPRRNPSAPATLGARVAAAEAHLHHARPHVGAAHEAMSHAIGRADHARLTFVVSAMGDTAAWLHRKAEGIWLTHRGDRLPVATQRTLTNCSHCSAWRSELAVTGDLCPDCHTFRHRNKCLPTEPIVRRWELGKSATPGQIIEAKSRPRARQARSA